MKSISLSVKLQAPCTNIRTNAPISSLISSCSISPSQPRPLRTLISAISSPSPSSSSSFSPISSSLGQAQEEEKQSCNKVYNVGFKTMGGCKLGISGYPDFEYDAQGGSGFGTGEYCDSNGQILVSFDISKLYIPPLTSSTTKFLGLPLPPIFRIDIEPQAFLGTIHQDSGRVDLEFKAKFWFSAGTFYKAPPLVVDTVLTTEESEGQFRKGRGARLEGDGKCKLVGVAKVEPIDDAFMNTFLRLPTECLAVLSATISLQ